MDVGLFNLLALYMYSSLGNYPPFFLKTVSTIAAVAFTYILNARWTFKSRTGRPEGLRRIGLYVLINLIGLGFILASLGVSRFLLGFDSLLADNISANIVGVILAWSFRFFANRRWVFIEAPSLQQ